MTSLGRTSTVRRPWDLMGAAALALCMDPVLFMGREVWESRLARRWGRMWRNAGRRVRRGVGWPRVLLLRYRPWRVGTGENCRRS